MSRRYYNRDPHWITTRYGGQCSRCSRQIARGERAFYWPSSRELECDHCGETSSARFEAEATDEATAAGGWC
jgi:DNA-directed RNA polymerase subunit RPC12/RpoP